MSKSKEFFDGIEERLEQKRRVADAGHDPGQLLEEVPYEQFGIEERTAQLYAREVLEGSWENRFNDPQEAFYRKLVQEEAGTEYSLPGPGGPQSPTSPF